MKDRKNMVMVIIIGITISLFLCFNTTVFATTGTVIATDLRLRKEESTTSEILTLLDQNDEVEILSENGDWYKIKADGKVGYVNKQYIKVKENNVVANITNTEENATSENTKSDENTSSENSTSETNQAENNEADTTNSNTANEETNNSEPENTNKIKQATVSAESQVRILPLINGDIINTAKSGEKYEVISNVGLWSYIKGNEKDGWILTEKLSITEESVENETNNQTQSNPNAENTENEENNAETATTEKEEEEKKEEKETSYSKAKTYYVKGTSVNARSEANKTSSVVKKLNTNDEVKVTGESGDWYVVEISGKKAYILKTLLSSKKVETTSRSSTSLDENNNSSQQEQSTPEPETVSNSSSSAKGEEVVAYAKQFLGYRYVYGTNGPNTFDCSGFVQYVYKHFGYSLSRSSKTQANDGVAVSKSNLQPGDILIFKNTAKTEIGHVGIYIGNDQFIHASNSKTGVIISSLSSASYQQRYVTARRIL